MRVTLFPLLLAVVVTPVWTSGVSGATETPETVSGPAIAINGDTLRIGSRKVRLFGIDAPERRTRTGPLATAMLDELLAGRAVSCTLVHKGLYREEVGRCAVAAGPADLSLEMVRSGWAAADRRYTTDYDAPEREARAARRGLWADLPVGERERDFWDQVERYQRGLGALIGAFFGLLALLGGALYNAKLTRRRDERLRDQDAKALAGALSAEIAEFTEEIGAQRQLFQKQHKNTVGFDPAFVKGLTLVPPEIYLRNIERLTLLPSGTVRDVVAFYLCLSQIENLHKQISSTEGPSQGLVSTYEQLSDISGKEEEQGNKTVAALDDFVAGKPPPKTPPIDKDAVPSPEPDTPPPDDKNAA